MSNHPMIQNGEKAAMTLNTMRSTRSIVDPAIKKGLQDTVYQGIHHQKILQRGWEPWSIPEEMILGVPPHAEDLVHSRCLPYAIALSIIVGLAFIGGYIFLGIWIKPDYFALFFTAPIVFAICIVIAHFPHYDSAPLHQRYESRFTRAHERQTRSKDDTRYESTWSIEHGKLAFLCYAGEMPQHLYKKLKRDWPLFDETYIGSFDKEAFFMKEISRPTYQYTDPFLIGIKDECVYLGGVWNVSNELDQADSIAETTL